MSVQLQISKTKIIFRTIHGELILGAWSKYFSKVVFEKQNSLAQIQSMNDRAVRYYVQFKPVFGFFYFLTVNVILSKLFIEWHVRPTTVQLH